MASDREYFGGGRACPNCGQSVQGDDRFCPSCGSAVGAGTIARDRDPWGGSETRAGVEYMGFWVRLVATLIDAVIIGIPTGLLNVVTFGIVGTLISVLYYVLFTGLKGQTVGKMVMGIKVVNAQGEPPGIGKAALRELIGKFLSGIALGLGYLWIIWEPERRGWHDRIGGTRVIRAPGR